MTEGEGSNRGSPDNITDPEEVQGAGVRSQEGSPRS